MLLRVEYGYVSRASKLFGRGEVVELDDTAAARLLRSGQAVRVDETAEPSTKEAAAEPDAAGLPDLGTDAVITPAKSGQKRK